MIIYWIAAKKPMTSKAWTLHPEAVISRTYELALEKLRSLVTIPEDEWILARVQVPEKAEECWDVGPHMKDKHEIPLCVAMEIGRLVDGRITEDFHIPADSALSMIQEAVANGCMEYASITMLERESLAEHCLRDILYALDAKDVGTDRERNERAVDQLREYFQHQRPQVKPCGIVSDGSGVRYECNCGECPR